MRPHECSHCGEEYSDGEDGTACCELALRDAGDEQYFDRVKRAMARMPRRERMARLERLADVYAEDGDADLEQLARRELARQSRPHRKTTKRAA